MIEEQHSRLPVYQQQPEQIIGILHYKDLLPVWQERRAAIRTGRTPRPFQVRPPGVAAAAEARLDPEQLVQLMSFWPVVLTHLPLLQLLSLVQ